MKKEKRAYYIRTSRKHWELFAISLLVALAILIFLPYLKGDKTFAETLMGGNEKLELENIEDRTIKAEDSPESIARDEVDVKLNVTPE